MPFQGLPSIPLRLPDFVPFLAVQPEQEFFLGALCFLATSIGRYERLVGPEIVWYVVGQVREERWPKTND